MLDPEGRKGGYKPWMHAHGRKTRTALALYHRLNRIGLARVLKQQTSLLGSYTGQT